MAHTVVRYRSLRFLSHHIKQRRGSRMQSSACTDEAQFERKGNAVVITLNRPKALNALNLPMIHKLYPAINEWENDPSVGVIIMKGAGEKAFCAGGDVRAIAEAGPRGDSLPQVFFKEEYKLNHRIGTLKTPFVALIDGITMGGGVGLSVHGHHRVASEKTLFAMPETAIGFFPDVGGGYFLPRLRRHLGTFLALTGYRLKGMDTYHAGIATHFVNGNEISSLEKALTSLQAPDPSSVSDVLAHFHDKTSSEASDNFSLNPHLERIERHFSKNSLEAIVDSMKSDESEWVRKQLMNMLKMSPLSMKVTLRLMAEGLSLSLAEDLKLEYRLSQRFMADKDFYEGIRAVLIDRDNQPKWNPSTIESVTDEKVASYFAPLPADRELQLP